MQRNLSRSLTLSDCSQRTLEVPEFGPPGIWLAGDNRIVIATTVVSRIRGPNRECARAYLLFTSQNPSWSPRRPIAVGSPCPNAGQK